MFVFGEKTVVYRDAIYEALITDWEHDGKIAVYLSIILPAQGEVARKVFKDHLPGGQWENSSEEIRRKSTGTQYFF